MKRKTLRIAIALFVAVVAVLLPLSSALAIADPDSYGINSVLAYRHCVEVDDQLYLISLNLNYAVNPTETADQAFIVRLMDGSTELGATTITNYQDDGYGKSYVSIYFPAATAPTWSGSYSVYVQGSPTLSWSGDPPSKSSGVDYWSSSTGLSATRSELSSRVLSSADDLYIAWAGTALTEITSLGKRLSSYGASYFMSIIANARTVAPDAFSDITTSVEFPDRTPTTGNADTLGQLLDGSSLDPTEAAAIFGVSAMWAKGTIWLIIMGVVLFLVIRFMKTTKGAILIGGFMLIAGGTTGFLPLAVGVGMGVLAVLGAMYVMFLSKSGA